MLIAVTIASVAVHTNATISESPIATFLHTEGGPFLGSRLLPDIWTSPASPLVISEARRLTANPVAYAEASRLTLHPVAFSEVLLSRLCRLLLRRVSTHSGARLLRGASPPGGPLRLLRGSSSHGGPRRLLKGTSPPGDHHQLSGWDSLQSQDLAISENPFMGICVLQDAPTGNSSLHREIPFSPDIDAMRRETFSPQQLHSPWASSQDPYQGFFRSLLAGSSHHDSRRYLRFVEKELTSSKSYASG